MVENKRPSQATSPISPDYPGLVQFLVEPFLESPESLSIDWEVVNNKQRVWIRLAFEGEDKGRVFGRGGRNVQAIRTVLSAAAAAAGQSLYLNIYEGEGEREGERHQVKPRNSNRSNFPKRPERKKLRHRQTPTDRFQ